jgi:hypothetical protein
MALQTARSLRETFETFKHLPIIDRIFSSKEDVDPDPLEDMTRSVVQQLGRTCHNDNASEKLMSPRTKSTLDQLYLLKGIAEHSPQPGAKSSFARGFEAGLTQCDDSGRAPIDNLVLQTCVVHSSWDDFKVKGSANTALNTVYKIVKDEPVLRNALIQAVEDRLATAVEGRYYTKIAAQLLENTYKHLPAELRQAAVRSIEKCPDTFVQYARDYRVHKRREFRFLEKSEVVKTLSQRPEMAAEMLRIANEMADSLHTRNPILRDAVKRSLKTNFDTQMASRTLGTPPTAPAFALGQ